MQQPGHGIRVGLRCKAFCGSRAVLQRISIADRLAPSGIAEVRDQARRTLSGPERVACGLKGWQLGPSRSHSASHKRYYPPCPDLRPCSGSRHHHFGSSSSRSDLLISSVCRRNCPGNQPTAQPSPNGRRGSRQSPGGNHSPKHSWFSQTAVGTTSPLSINPSPTRAPAAKVTTPNAPSR